LGPVADSTRVQTPCEGVLEFRFQAAVTEGDGSVGLVASMKAKEPKAASKANKLKPSW
jgi:hypothetical protein